MFKSNLKKLPPATVQAIVKRLNGAGTNAWMTHDHYAAFSQGIIGIPPGGKIPIIFFDVRATDADIEQVVLALHEVGSWALANDRIYLKKNAAGIRVLTMEEAECEFAIGRPDRRSRKGGTS